MVLANMTEFFMDCIISMCVYEYEGRQIRNSNFLIIFDKRLYSKKIFKNHTENQLLWAFNVINFFKHKSSPFNIEAVTNIFRQQFLPFLHWLHQSCFHLCLFLGFPCLLFQFLSNHSLHEGSVVVGSNAGGTKGFCSYHTVKYAY